jgi:predicted nucleic acid-binding protein
LVKATIGADLVAPESIHWEIGNAFSAMFKRKAITLDNARVALKIYQEIPIRYVGTDLEDALVLAEELNIYPYDAYLLVCCAKYNAPLLTLDKQLAMYAEMKGIETIRIG